MGWRAEAPALLIKQPPCRLYDVQRMAFLESAMQIIWEECLEFILDLVDANEGVWLWSTPHLDTSWMKPHLLTTFQQPVSVSSIHSTWTQYIIIAPHSPRFFILCLAASYPQVQRVGLSPFTTLSFQVMLIGDDDSSSAAHLTLDNRNH